MSQVVVERISTSGGKQCYHQAVVVNHVVYKT